MQFSNKIRKWGLLVITCVIIPSAVVFSQPGDPDGPGDGTDPGTGVPFDGGVSLLVAAGIGYGVKKAHDARKKAAAASEETTG